jgi:RNA polymerase sporulation-specific sigma factor
MLKLTDDQRKLTEDNYKLAYFTVIQMNLGVDQYIGAAEIGLCKAAATWNSTISTFATYSTTVMRNEIFMQMREERSLPKNTVSIDQPLETGSYKLSNRDYFEQLGTPDLLEMFEEIENKSDLKTAYLKAQQCMTDIEKQSLTLSLMGLNQSQIGGRIGISQSYVSRCIKNAFSKIRAKYYMNETEYKKPYKIRPSKEKKRYVLERPTETRNLEVRDIGLKMQESKSQQCDLELQKRNFDTDKRDFEREKRELDCYKKDLERQKRDLEIEKRNIEREKRELDHYKRDLELQNRKLKIQSCKLERQIRNLEIMRLRSSGLSYQAIANQLNMPMPTVRSVGQKNGEVKRKRRSKREIMEATV